MSTIKRVFWISLFLKLILAAFLPITSDEAYYWVWSQHLQLSYYDHPPFVAWLFALGEQIRVFDGMVRWPGVLVGHAAIYIWLNILEPYLSEEQRLMWLLLALLSPLLGGSGLIVTPDLPLLFFYAASLWLFFRWQKNPDWKLTLAFGLTMGLGFSSKYMMVLFAMSLMPLIIISAKLRRNFIRQLPLLLLGGLLGTLPVWLWNFMNDFVSIKFQAAHGLGRRWKPSWTIEYILVQIGVIFPIVIYWAAKARGRLPLVFHFLAWTPLLFFLFTTSRGYVEANWPIAAYPAIFALAASHYPRNARGLKFTVALWATLISALAILVVVKPDWSKKIKLKEFHRFDRVLEVSQSYEPLYARSYQMAARIYFSRRRPVYKLRGMNRKDFFDFLEHSEPKERRYFVAVEKTDKLPMNYIAAGHTIVQTIPVDDIYEIWEVSVP